MHCRARMSDVGHGLVLRNIVARHLCGDRDPVAVKANPFFFQTDFSQEPEPGDCRPLSAVPIRPGRCSFVGLELGEERSQSRVQSRDVVPGALDVEMDRPGHQVDVGHGVEQRLTDAAALVPGYFERVRKHFLSVGVNDLLDLRPDFCAILIGEFRLLGLFLFSETQLHARVAGDEPALYCFVQDNAQCFQVLERGVVTGRVLAAGFVGLLAPSDERIAMVAPELGRRGNLLLLEENAERAPASEISLQRVSLGVVADLQPVANPGPAVLVRGTVPALEFLGALLQFDDACPANVGADANPATSRFGFDGSVRGAVLDPKKRRIFSLVQTGHSERSLT